MRDFTEGMVNACSYVLTATMTKEVLQIISLCATILGTLVIIFTKAYDWYKRAKADGVITKEEIKQGINEVSDDVKQLTEEADELCEIIEEQHKED